MSKYEVQVLNILLASFLLFANSEVSAQEEGRLLGSWSDSTLVSSAVFGNAYNEVWGYAARNREYAIIGSTSGTHFIDITDPTAPDHLHLIEGGSTGPVIIHRDYHDYQGYLYAVSDEGNESTLQIMDLSFLPDSVPVVYDSKELIRRSHNIFIDTSSAILYCCTTAGESLPLVQLRTFDLSIPTQPELIRSYTDIGDFILGDAHDIFVRNDTAYINAGNFGMVVADFSDPLEPIELAALSTADYPDSGYNHSGWLSADGTTYVLADETWNRAVKIMDVSSLPDIEVTSLVDADNESIFSIPHNEIIHNNFLYVAYYYDGLQVYDIAKPDDPKRIMHFPTSKLAPRRSFEGAWGVYPFLDSGVILVSDMQEGLLIIEGVERLINSNEELGLDGSELVISPNPTSGSFSLSLEQGLSNSKITISSITGEHIQNLDNSGHYNLNLQSGVYIIKIQKKDNSEIIRKIVVAN